MSFDVTLRNPGSGFNISLANSPPPANESGYLKVWSGTEWVLKPLKVWSGTEWVIKPVKRWTGSIWEIVHFYSPDFILSLGQTLDSPIFSLEGTYTAASSFGSDVIHAWDPFSGGNSSGFVPDAVGSTSLWVRDQSTTVINWDGVFNDRELLIIDGTDVQASITNNTNISISLWYNWATTGSNPSNGSPIIGHGDGWPGGSATDGSFQILSGFDGSLGLYIHNNGFSSSAFSSAGVITRDTWYMITLTAGPGGWRVYVNSTLVVDLSAVNENLPNINRVLAFGAYWILIENTQTSHNDTFSNHFDYYWAGNMGDIRIHNKILSSTEVSDLYNAGRQTY